MAGRLWLYCHTEGLPDLTDFAAETFNLNMFFSESEEHSLGTEGAQPRYRRSAV